MPYEIAAHEHRIFGPPGTGKTTTLSKIVARLVEHYGGDNVIVSSFTRAAAAELVGRGLPVPKDNIKTLHAFGYMLLGGNLKIAEENIALWNSEAPSAFHLNPGSSRLDLDDPYAAQETSEEKSTRAYDGDDKFTRYMLRRARRKSLERGMAPLDIVQFHARWTTWKQKHNFVDFADMIELPLQRRLALPDHFKTGVFDEFQDFTALEIALIRLWAEMGSWEEYYCSLDDDQTLYSFKGASIDACLDPPILEEHRTVLSQSHRVPHAVQRYATAWIKQVARREEKAYQPRADEGAVLFVDRDGATLRGSYREPSPLLDIAEEFLRGTNAKGEPRTVMFLATCSYMLNPLKEALRERGIPFHNRYRQKRSDWNPLTPANGTSSLERLLAFLRLSPAIYGDHAARLWTIQELLDWTEVLTKSGVLRVKRAELEEYRASLGKNTDLLEQPLSFDDTQLGRWLTDEALVWAFEQDLQQFENHLLAARREGMRLPLTIARKAPAQLRQTPRITIGTIHSVKGGQADEVFLFPDLSQKGYLQWVGDNREAHDSLTRTMYVGMTRAYERLVICPPSSDLAVRLPAEMPPVAS